MPTQKKILTKDLCPKKPDANLLDVGDTTATVEVIITAKKELVSSRFDRLVAAAEKKMDEYQKIVQTEVTILEGKVKAAQAKGDQAEMESLVGGTSASVQKACAALQGAVETDLKALIKKESNEDQNLRDAKLAVAAKISFKGISLAHNAARIVASHGADVLAWKGLIMDLVGIGKIIADLCKSENTLRKELLMDIGKYCTDKQRRVIEEQKAAESKKAKFVLIGKDLYRAFKPEAEKAEAARKKYRDKVTGIRQSVDKFFEKVDHLAAALKKAPDVKEGVAIGAKLMVIKRTGEGMAGSLLKAQTFADDMAYLLTEAGIEVDNATFKERLTSLAVLPDLAGLGSSLYTAGNDLVGLVTMVV